MSKRKLTENHSTGDAEKLCPARKKTGGTKQKYGQYPVFRPPTFALQDVEHWKAHLDTEGFVVIEKILDLGECRTALGIFQKEWARVSPNFKWNDKTTWTTDNCPMVWGKSSAMFNGFGQSMFMWYLRSLPQVKKPFSELFETEDLAVSLDGFSVFLSPKQKSPKWLHQDQRSQDSRLSVQGLVNIFGVKNTSAGFVCVPRSHTLHVPPPSKTDWVMLDGNSPWYDKAVKLIVPPRCLVLWHSKLLHTNTGMTSIRGEQNNVHLNRLSAYITFAPKSRQTPEIMERRKAAYKAGLSCSHWIDRCEVKKIPFHLCQRYENREFQTLSPLLTEEGDIPKTVLSLL